MKLAVAVTVGQRVNGDTVYDYFEKSVFSFRQAGFSEELHAFVEPGAEQHVPNRRRWKINVHQNDTRLNCFPNFKHGLRWLVDNTDADWLFMLQDDANFRQDCAARVHEAINRDDLQQVGMLSPYTSKAMIPPGDMPRAGVKRVADKWVTCKFHNKAFWGAVAMLFPRASAVAMMEDQRSRFVTHNHHRKLDVVVGNSLRRDIGLDIMVHVPSLVDHMGSWSTLGRHRLKGNQWGRRGFMFRTK